MNYFYDSQTRRFLLQFMRIFSEMYVRNGPDENGMYTLSRVPIVYGDPSNMVAQIIKGQSENTMLPVPMMSAYIDSIKMAPDRRRDTQFVQPLTAMEREFNETTQTYGPGAGTRYGVERYMPVPYDLYLKLDIWTSNTTNKLQILEQIQMIFNPSIMLQQNSNILDWTSIFEVWLEEITWTNRSIPQGGDNTRDVASLRFKLPIWISPPAKVTRSRIIEEIVTRIKTVDDIDPIRNAVANNIFDPFGCMDSETIQIVTTVGNYEISVNKNNLGIDEITLLHPYGNVNAILDWNELFSLYGKIEPSITSIRLKLNPDLDSDSGDILGTIELDPLRKNVLIFTPDQDTLPANTLQPITDIIDPTSVVPGAGLPLAAAGQRYLLTGNSDYAHEPVIPPGVVNSPWGGNFVAYQNDIIQFNGTAWEVIFDSLNSTGKNYVVNNSNQRQYLFENIEKGWTYSYLGTYSPGYWRVENLIKTTTSSICDNGNNSI